MILPLILSSLLAGTPLVLANASRETEVASEVVAAGAPAKNCAPDSKQIEKDLQHLPWKQFRSIVESIPTLKSGIDAYGPIGWKIVQANYTTYPWKKNVDKLDDLQKKRLIESIQNAKGGGHREYCDQKGATSTNKYSPEPT